MYFYNRLLTNIPVNKKTPFLIIFIVSGIVFGMLIYVIKVLVKTGNAKIELSEFAFIDSRGNIFNVSDTTRLFLVVFFKSDCPFCFDEIKQITENIDKFKQAKVLFVSNDSLKYIKYFEHNFNVPSVYFLQDNNANLRNRLQIKKYPTIFIISGEGKILKKKIGFASIEYISSAMQNE